MYDKSAAPLRIDAGPSRRLGLYLWATHLGALALVPWFSLAWYFQLSLGALIGLSLARGIRTHALRSAACAVRAAELDGEGAWTLLLADGRVLSARLLDSSLVHPLLLVLNFHTGRLGRRHLVLAPDSANADQVRRLRVRLREAGARPPA